MRLHHTDTENGEPGTSMNACQDDDPFGVIILGQSQLCLDSREDAEKLIRAAARIAGWFDVTTAHEFGSLEGPGVPYGPCAECGRLKSSRLHAEPDDGPGEGGILLPAGCDPDTVTA